MFRKITRLLFGGEEDTPEDVMSGEGVDEGWLVVSHQDASSAEAKEAEVPTQLMNSVFNGQTFTKQNTDTSVTDPETTVESSSGISNSQAIAGFVQPKAPSEVTQLTCIQKAKCLANRHHMTRNAIQRQNRVEWRQGVLHQSFHLQQPGHRNLSH